MTTINKIGICFGGYCPLHQGHMDVIMQAKKENDICIVIVCGYDNEPRGWEINLNLNERHILISNFFKDDQQISVEAINDTTLGIDESMCDNNWKIWQKEVKRLLSSHLIYPNEGHKYDITWYVAEPFYKSCIEKNNVLQEEYGEFASVKVILVDKTNPVSGTQIRQNPIKYWNKITTPFKPFLCKNILIIGTASEGKSTLVRDIGRYFDIPYAEEFGRNYMETMSLKDTDLTYDEFVKFLFGQNQECAVKREQSKSGIFISDTDNTVTLMYAKAYVDDKAININQKDYEELYRIAKTLNDNEKYKWDHIFIFPPNKNFVDDGTRYMEQASMDERMKNFAKLQILVNDFYPEVGKTYLNGTFLENFNEVKKYINGLLNE